MAQDGEAIYQEFTLIADNPFPAFPAVDIKECKTDCCGDFTLHFLADTANSDPLRNDFFGFIKWYDPVIATAEMFLMKHNGVDYIDVDALDDNSYGTFYPYGFFINGQGEKFIGYKIDWQLVLIAFGPGGYKIRVALTASIGSPALTGEDFSDPLCVFHYTPHTADGTVRIEYNITGVMGRADSDRKLKDFIGLDWYSSLRFKGWFGFPSAEYETTYTEFTNGERQFVEDEQEPEYLLKLKQLPHFAHEIMRVDVMQADTVYITDYNCLNAGTYVQKYVQKNSGYSPAWEKSMMQSKLAPVEVKWRQQFNNLKKLRC